MALEGILQELGVLSILAGAIVLIARKAIQQYFDKSLQAYQSELEKEKIRYSDLHTKRGEVIAEFYARLNEFDEDMRQMVDPVLLRGDESRDEKIERAVESGEEFRRYYRKHKIYFRPDVCETMESLLSQYRDMFHDFSIRRIHEHNSPTDTASVEEWNENWESLTKNEIPELRAELESQFRDLLGVETESETEIGNNQSQQLERESTD